MACAGAVGMLAIDVAPGAPPATSVTAAAGYASDFDQFWHQIAKDYPYFRQNGVDWDCVRTVYAPQAAASPDRNRFIRVLEQALDELDEPHAELNVNLASSYRLVPSGLDLWAEWQGGRAVVTQLRPGGGALAAGLAVGMEIIEINGVPIAKASASRLGRCQRGPSAAARNWALLSALAGRHDTPRSIVARRQGQTRTYLPDQAAVQPAYSGPEVSWRRLDQGLGYVAIHNLGASDTVAQFDAALDRLRDTQGLVLDLRDTPTGGNTGVAEPILGRFIQHAQPYQRVLPPHGPAWSEPVLPRGPWVYQAPLAVLTSRWTASMGEGLAIGLQGMHRATLVGTAMAGLRGGVFTQHLPYAGFDFSYPGYGLARLDGTPREQARPDLEVDLARVPAAVGSDPVLAAGLRVLARSTRLAQGHRLRTP